MSLSFYVLVLLPLFLVPALTGRLALNARRWQERQITIDNAGILLGKAERALMRELATSNQKVLLLEREHHPTHQCQRSPFSNAACAAADIASEVAIAAIHESAYVGALAKWQAARIEVEAYLRAHGSHALVRRRPLPPIHSQTCPVCGLSITWEKDSGDVRSEIFEQGEPDLGVEVWLEGKTLLLEGVWNYRLASGRAEVLYGM